MNKGLCIQNKLMILTVGKPTFSRSVIKYQSPICKQKKIHISTASSIKLCLMAVRQLWPIIIIEQDYTKKLHFLTLRNKI